MKEILSKLAKEHTLSEEEYYMLLNSFSEKNDNRFEIMTEAANYAKVLRERYYGNEIFVRGLIEITNYCRNDCFYCGIRKSNHKCDRYMLTKQQILECCHEGYAIGFRTFVLQGGEGIYNVGVICDIVKEIKQYYPDCAVTLSLGEYEKEDYQKMYNAGADRYLLRHETADQLHYEKLHPKEMSFEHRMNCLKVLKEVGFATGCGFMVGSPNQTVDTLVKDLKFIEIFKPEMCGIGPFIPQKDTPFGNETAGSVEWTVFLLSIIRMIHPRILLPSTTALGTIEQGGREKGILAGANVIMPNLSPTAVRKKYALYDHKLCTGTESAQALEKLKQKMKEIGYEIVTSRGDMAKE